jgi:hypothetical protein
MRVDAKNEKEVERLLCSLLLRSLLLRYNVPRTSHCPSSSSSTISRIMSTATCSVAQQSNLVVMVTGTRHDIQNRQIWKHTICTAMDQLQHHIISGAFGCCFQGVTLVHGGCSGVDLFCGQYADEVLGWKIKEYPADWKKYGNGAGPIRNKQMIVTENPHIVLAFPYAERGKSLATTSKGTYNCMEQVRQFVLDHDDKARLSHMLMLPLYGSSTTPSSSSGNQTKVIRV